MGVLDFIYQYTDGLTGLFENWYENQYMFYAILAFVGFVLYVIWKRVF